MPNHQWIRARGKPGPKPAEKKQNLVMIAVEVSRPFAASLSQCAKQQGVSQGTVLETLALEAEPSLQQQQLDQDDNEVQREMQKYL